MRTFWRNEFFIISKSLMWCFHLIAEMPLATMIKANHFCVVCYLIFNEKSVSVIVNRSSDSFIGVKWA